MNDTLDITEAAELLKVSTETVREMASSGQLIGAKIGVAWVFIKDDLMDYLRRETRRQTNERLARTRGELADTGTVKTAVTNGGSRQHSRRRKGLPDLSTHETTTR